MRPVARAARVLSSLSILVFSLELHAQDPASNAAPMAKRRSVRSVGAPAPSPAVAVNDAYEVAQGSVLTVPAPGVLTNDTPNGASISGYGATSGLEQATIGAATASARGGTVRVDASGGLSYTPAASFSGTDTFLYTLTNGAGSSTATVTLTVRATAPTTFTVTSPGFFFEFDSIAGQNPRLTLVRGRTYTFIVETSPIHPFEIVGAPPGSVENNNISQGVLVFTVPITAQNYRYRCSIHEFGNVIETVAPSNALPPQSTSMESNRRNAVNFYQAAYDDLDVQAAVAAYASPAFVFHDSRGDEVAASRLGELVRSLARTRSEIRNVLVDGDRVAIHAVRHLPDGRTERTIELFRLDARGRVVEQWSTTAFD
ncbi:MAG: Ig-like domain-containing protein [Thermoanaerobaculia bacterium]